MTQPDAPFAIARPLGGQLDALLTYWQALRRGAAEIPFWDDVDLSQAQKIGGEVFLLDVFAQPERFRFSILQQGVSRAEQEAILGRFIDEVNLPHPFQLLRAQCSATVEEQRPTVYRHADPATVADNYERLLLPAWGEGQVRMLLGAVARG
ncbi:hypothetical protein [Phenylobacterium sp.]|uniref:hypothetical protein n=1 Tax=Phenylobacterium sp. TaxID=1871053 RepID=UPI003BAD96D3